MRTKPFKMLLGYALAAAVFLVLCTPPSHAAFRDVGSGSWYEGAVTQLTQAGALTGYPDGTFRPGQPISAAEFVTVAVRLAGLPDAQGQSAHWAAGAMQAALQAGWYDWDEIPPTGERFDLPIPRQLAVKILMRALLPDARGDYVTESAKIKDFASLDGRYYETVLAAYASGIVHGDPNGAFRPLDSLSRAEACTLFQNAGAGQTGQSPVSSQPLPTPSQPIPAPVQTRQGGVSQNGWLQVTGTQLCSETGQPVVLRGMSSHGLQWYGQFASDGAISSLADCGANLFRAAMYTGEGGYLSQPDAMKAKLTAAVDAAVANDLYVIIDWHILSDGDPMAHVTEAEAFFSEMAQRYRDTPNVLYEICNEPNGNVGWDSSVKPYAQRVIRAIRAHSPKAVILVGSTTWSQDIHLAAADPLDGENLMYTLHFYAGTHGAQLRQRIDDALAKGLPVFVSEWGTSRADGSGGVFLEESRVWLDFLDERGISWCNWSLCDKNETSAALRPGASSDGPWGQEKLSESGQFVFSRFSQ